MSLRWGKLGSSGSRLEGKKTKKTPKNQKPTTNKKPTNSSFVAYQFRDVLETFKIPIWQLKVRIWRSEGTRLKVKVQEEVTGSMWREEKDGSESRLISLQGNIGLLYIAKCPFVFA